MSHAQGLVWSSLLSSIRSQYPAVPQLSTDSLAVWLDDPDRPAPVLLDVRTPDEYAVSHLAGAIRIDPDTEDYTALADLPPGTPIVAYCSVGYRSSALADRLLRAGFSNVNNLEGSIFTWANESRPVYRDSVEVRQVHPYNRLWGTLLDRSLRNYEGQ
jgi:rhodanese-related sulfurtransferase